MSSFLVKGLYKVDAPEPVYLVEVEFSESLDFDWMEVTQEIPNIDRMDWQVPYDEQLIEKKNEIEHWVFFFHYLKLNQPLKTPFGDIELPQPTELPKHLKTIEYQEP